MSVLPMWHGCIGRKIIVKMFQNVSFSKINRHANVVAYEIAKFSFNSRSDGLLVNSVSPCVAYAVITDCNNLLFN